MKTALALLNKIWNERLFLRYIIVGGSASLMELALLYLFTDILGNYYLYSSAIAMSIAFFLRFFMQKLLAFKSNSFERINHQFLFYSILYLFSLVSTVLLLRLLVEFMGIWYILGQCITILMIAAVSFFVYKYVIFYEHRVLRR